MRGVRQAYWSYFLVQEEAGLTGRIAILAEELTELTDRRLRAGDISELELHLVRLQALSARDRAEQLKLEVPAIWEQLRLLTGLNTGAVTRGTVVVLSMSASKGSGSNSRS